MISRNEAYKETMRRINNRELREFEELIEIKNVIMKNVKEGYFSCFYLEPISDGTLKALKGKGFDVKECSTLNKYYEISWGPKEE